MLVKFNVIAAASVALLAGAATAQDMVVKIGHVGPVSGPQAHYGLAMAYRGMGLVDQAMESFRLAAREPEFRQRCAEMIGRCLLEAGRFEEAATELTQALAFASLEPEVAAGVRFHLGRSPRAMSSAPAESVGATASFRRRCW